jgi:hypothetical protein
MWKAKEPESSRGPVCGGQQSVDAGLCLFAEKLPTVIQAAQTDFPVILRDFLMRTFQTT